MRSLSQPILILPSASVVCHVGANLVLVDCQQNSLEMDYDALEAAITEKTK